MLQTDSLRLLLQPTGVLIRAGCAVNSSIIASVRNCSTSDLSKLDSGIKRCHPAQQAADLEGGKISRKRASDAPESALRTSNVSESLAHD